MWDYFNILVVNKFCPSAVNFNLKPEAFLMNMYISNKQLCIYIYNVNKGLLSLNLSCWLCQLLKRYCMFIPEETIKKISMSVSNYGTEI